MGVYVEDLEILSRGCPGGMRPVHVRYAGEPWGEDVEWAGETWGKLGAAGWDRLLVAAAGDRTGFVAAAIQELGVAPAPEAMDLLWSHFGAVLDSARVALEQT